MRKILVFLAVIALICSFAACGEQTPTTAPAGTTTAPTVAPTDPVETPTANPTQPTEPTEPPTEPTEPPTEPTEPPTEPTVPPTEPTEPPTEPTVPPTEPAEPPTEPTEPPTEPTVPPTEPTEPPTEPTEPPTEPTEPPTEPTEPTEPPTEPTEPPTEPTEPPTEPTEPPTEPTEPPHVHDYTPEVTKEATCTAEGVKTFTCSCGDSYTEPVEKLPHSYTAVVTAPTCTEKGCTTYTCSCGDSYADDDVDALGHTPGAEATCTTAQICSVCSAELVAALGHDEVSHDAQPATCTEIGWDAYVTCSRCNYSTYAEISAFGHTSAAAVEENRVEPDCTVPGSYESVIYCSVCNAELSREAKVIDALGHDEVTHDAQPATCTEIGWDAYVTCSRCDYSTYAEIAALGHDEENHEAKAATCAQIGWEAYVTCSRCNYTTYEEIAALGHTPGAAATCTTAQTCTVCSAELVAALGHTKEEIPAVAPTCTETGLTAGVKCSVCGKILTVQTEVAATGHTSAAAVEENRVEASCTTPGSYESVIYCSVCNAELSRETKVINALGHTPGAAATCTTAQNCTVCSAELSAALGHSYTSVVTEPTATEQGYTTHTCSACGHSYIDSYTDPSVPTIIASGTCGDNLTWTLDDKGLLTISGLGAMYDYSYSSMAPWYSCREQIKKVLINNGITSIGCCAFYWCTNLTSITIPDSVTDIGYSAFEGCTGMNSITIGNSVTSIGNHAFQACTGLTNITIPDSVTKIGSSAFSGCNSLESLTLPFVGNTKEGTSNTYFGYIFGAGSYSYNNDYVPSSLKTVVITSATRIHDYAFSECSSVTSITIPDSVTEIGNSAFYGCSSLESMTLPFVGASSTASVLTASHVFGYIFGTNSYSGGTATQQYYTIPSALHCYSICYIPSSLKTVTITGGNIHYGAFDGCAGLTSITIPDSITSIGTYAFRGCSSLTSITIPDSVTSIGTGAFSGCARLMQEEDGVFYVDKWIVGCGSSITTPTLRRDTVGIGSSAFSGCTGLTSITIPDSVTSIGSYAFDGCSSLKSIEVDSSNTVYCSVSNCLIETETKTLVAGCKNSIIPDDGSVTSIGGYAFSGCTGLTSITIPASVTSIGFSAFSGCRSLTSITIPDGVTSIGHYAFRDCTGLTSITIPDSVIEIGGSAFEGCSSLESMTLPFVGSSATATTANRSTLFGWIFGTSSYSGGTATKQYYSSYSNHRETYYIPSSLKTVTITGGNILYGAFENCSNLTSITIGNGVTNIGVYAFKGCTGLTSVTFAEGSQLIRIDGSAFSGCSGLTSITIPDSVTEIGERAFYDCTGLTSITIGNGVTSIGGSAFSHCTSLTSITIPDSVTEIGYSAFEGCTGLTSITIGDSVTEIGYSAFEGCTGLTSITIPDSVTEIDQCAFEGCTGLTSVTIGNGVTSIGGAAFSGCTGLTSVYITDIVAWCSISFSGSTSNPLYYAGNLYINGKLASTIEIPESITSIGYSAFEGCTGLTSITIPDSMTEIGNYAFDGCTGLTRIIFNGTKAQWNAISKDYYWNRNTGKYTIYCTDGEISE